MDHVSLQQSPSDTPVLPEPPPSCRCRQTPRRLLTFTVSLPWKKELICRLLRLGATKWLCFPPCSCYFLMIIQGFLWLNRTDGAYANDMVALNKINIARIQNRLCKEHISLHIVDTLHRNISLTLKCFLLYCGNILHVKGRYDEKFCIFQTLSAATHNHPMLWLVILIKNIMLEVKGVFQSERYLLIKHKQ